MKQILIISLLIPFITLPVFAQDDGQWTHYPITDDLNLEYVTALTTDENGVLWVGTEEGLYRFDGNTWIFYSSKEIGAQDFISSLLFDTDSRLHLIAANYSTFYNDTWINHLDEIYHLNDFFPPESVDVRSNGVIWLGGYKSVVNYDGTSWVLHTIDIGSSALRIVSLAVDNSGNVWCGTNQGTVLKFDGETWSLYAEKNGLGDGTSDIKVRIGTDGTVWCAGYRWIARYEGNDTWIVIEGNPLLFSEEYLEIDSTGNAWIFDSPHFASYDGANWETYVLPDSESAIQSLTVDNNGVVWIGIYEDGIYRFDPNPIVVEETAKSPVPVSITGNYPNPFNGSTLISFQVPERDYYELSIFSINGQLIKTLISDTINKGGHQVYWNGKDAKNKAVASGIYIVCLQLGAKYDTHKITFTK